jgi:hypothetical protein
MMTPTEHNAAKWLTVRWEENSRGQGFLAGWYVVRVCPCHWGERVTLPMESEEEAQRLRRVLLGLEPPRRHNRTPEWPPQPDRPTTVLPGQVWRRNRYRDGRHFQVLEVERGAAVVRSVERTEDGHWAQMPNGQPHSRVALRRMLNRNRTAAWAYTLIE